ncbi:MAG TPA: lipopolysaccharide kinase InaA family protein [Gemmatimonadaceae bacterium]|nr:lipopolysaccharide kinase InaA family protein [Gemmatimonadaceae bacterium]
MTPPDGYVRARAGGAHVVARRPLLAGVEAALRTGTLYEYAARHPERRALAGRAPAYRVPLPDDGPPVVVRHSRHGGLLAPLTGDLFIAPTRAPRELAASIRLAAAGVPTPAIAAYVVYPVIPGLARADVATLALDGEDLAARLARPDRGQREAAWRATHALLARLAAAGARHSDLNMKNVLVVDAPGGGVEALVLDVDVVVFGVPGDPAVARANARRLLRSARKWRDQRGLRLDDGALAVLAGAAA